MNNLGDIFNPILDFLKAGFTEVNALQGLLIALFATVLMKRWAQIFAISLGAAAFYVVVEWIIPIATQGAAIKLPEIVNVEFWKHVGTLFVGFVIIVSMFFAVKSVVFRPAAAKGKRAH
jgi:hypothetical protein